MVRMLGDGADARRCYRHKAAANCAVGCLKMELVNLRLTISSSFCFA